MRFFCLFLLVFAGLLYPVGGYSQGFSFVDGSFEQAVSRASAEGKMLVVMTTASFSEAGDVMVDEVMADPKVGAYYNQHFLVWVLNVDPLAPQFVFHGIHLLQVPEYLFLDGHGDVQFRDSGFKSPEEMIETGAKALNPANHASALQAMYDAGKRDPEFMQRYIFTMTSNGKPVRDIAGTYLASLKPEALLTAPNWKITSAIVDNARSRECQHVVQNYGRYREKFGAEPVNQFLKDVYNLTFQAAVEGRDLAMLREAHPLLEKVYPAASIPGIRATVEMNYYEATGDWESYRAAAMKLLRKGSGHDATVYNDAATNFYYHVTDEASLKAALGWANLSIEMDRQPWNLDTRAALLFKTGDKEAAIQAAREATDLAGDDPDLVKFSLDLLKNEK